MFTRGLPPFCQIGATSFLAFQYRDGTTKTRALHDGIGVQHTALETSGPWDAMGCHGIVIKQFQQFQEFQLGNDRNGF